MRVWHHPKPIAIERYILIYIWEKGIFLFPFFTFFLFSIATTLHPLHFESYQFYCMVFVGGILGILPNKCARSKSSNIRGGLIFETTIACAVAECDSEMHSFCQPC